MYYGNNQNNFYNRMNCTQYNSVFEKKQLRKTSNGLGFFIASYFLLMYAVTFAISFIFAFTGNDSILSEIGAEYFLVSIFISVISAFIPSLMYFLISGRNISETIKVNAVKPGLLIPIVFVGMTAAMIANFASTIVITNFSIFGLENTVSFDNSSSSILNNILYVVSTAVVPALAEEFAFRGVLMGTLRKHGDSFAIITSAVIFGTMHGNIVQIPFAFILGLVFAFVDCKTNSIIPSIIIHFINNLYAVIMEILENENIIGEDSYTLVYAIVVTAFCVFGLISFLRLWKKDNGFFKINSITEKSACSLTLKERNKAFFTSAGVILSLSMFLIITVTNLGVTDV